MKKKAVLITGASSGIGEATAEEFSQRGWFVFLAGRNMERLERVGSRMRAGASLLKMDLADSGSIEKYSKHIYERSEVQLEALVNNAGIYESHAFEGYEISKWRAMFETNFFGLVDMTQRLMPYFLKQGRGSIVNVSSTLGLRPVASGASYSASKAALVSLTQSMALEYGSKGIRVNCICPGLVDTPIHQFNQFSEDKKNQYVQENLAKMQPLGRIGTPTEIAKSIYFLASEESSWTTGAILSVDGGINIA